MELRSVDSHSKQLLYAILANTINKNPTEGDINMWYSINLPTSIMSMTTLLIRITLRTNFCRLNLSSGSIYFFSLGCSVCIVARSYSINETCNIYSRRIQGKHNIIYTSFQTTLSSSKICGLLPLALERSLRSLSVYHLFWPLVIRSKGIWTAPRNSNRWSRSSS